MSLYRRPEQGPSWFVFCRFTSWVALFSDFAGSVCLKIDRLYDWKRSPDTDVVATLKKQKKNTKDEFDERAKAVIVEFAQQVSAKPFSHLMI